MDGNLSMANSQTVMTEKEMAELGDLKIEKQDIISEIIKNHKFGTMDNDCEHYIEKLYNENGDYKADYCIKCKGIY